MKIRPYTKKDEDMILGWWLQSGEASPTSDMLPTDSTFILEMNGIPMLCVSLYLLNIRQTAWIENLVGNPELSGSKRREATKEIVRFLTAWAKERGYLSLFCMSQKEPLKRYYQSLGFTETVSNISCFVKGIV